MFISHLLNTWLIEWMVICWTEFFRIPHPVETLVCKTCSLDRHQGRPIHGHGLCGILQNFAFDGPAFGEVDVEAQRAGAV